MLHFDDPSVAAVFDAYPPEERKELLQLRELIFDVASETQEAGEIQETLKWGQPSYLTVRPKSGTTIRLGLNKKGQPAVFTHCQTTVISDFQALFPDDFAYEGNRALIPGDQAKAKGLLRQFIRSTLLYHT